MGESKNLYFYKEYPKTCAPDDFWSQVKRTVNGRPVGEDQIQMIVDAVIGGLQIAGSDFLLDLCCGNGALSDRIFARCQGGVGVDFSDTLISVAEKYFQAPPQRLYRLEDVEAFLQSSDDTTRFTKALCYGSFQYLPHDKAESALDLLRRRFSHIERFFVGNIPDKAKMDVFFKSKNGAYIPGIENDPGSPIGIWRTEAEFADLAARHGWMASFRRMPDSYYGAPYRYDAVLTRLGG